MDVENAYFKPIVKRAEVSEHPMKIGIIMAAGY